MSCSAYFDVLYDEGKKPYSSFVGCCPKELRKTTRSIRKFSSSFSPSVSLFQMVQPYNCTDSATARKNYRFISSWISNFNMIGNLSVAVHALPICMLKPLPINVILATNFRGWLYNLILCRHMPLASCFKLCRRNSTQAGIFEESEISSE